MLVPKRQSFVHCIQQDRCAVEVSRTGTSSVSLTPVFLLSVFICGFQSNGFEKGMGIASTFQAGRMGKK